MLGGNVFKVAPGVKAYSLVNDVESRLIPFQVDDINENLVVELVLVLEREFEAL